MKNYLLILFFLFASISCRENKDDIIKPLDKKAKDYNSDIVNDYYNHYLNVVKVSDGYRPPISARALAYISMNIYEALAPSFKNHMSIRSQIKGLNLPNIDPTKTYHWGLVANTAFRSSFQYHLLVMNKEQFEKANEIENEYNKKFELECDSATYNRSVKFAKDVSEAIFDYSIKDGQTNAYRNNKPRDYVPPIGVGLWRSTGPDYLNALTPRWGEVRTLLVPANDEDYLPPIAFSKDLNSSFGKEAKEVYDAVKNTNTESKWIAEFWSDDLNSYSIDAAGRWFGIAINYIKQENVDLETSTYVLAKLGIGLHDSAVSCWKEKYKYNLLRPVSYINEYIDPNWKSILRDPTKPQGQQIGVTPQHPSYPSGHSVFGALAAEIMIHTFGDKIKFTDKTHEKETYFDGRPRTFTSFTAMANENAYSRIPLGVHYRMDCVEGLRIGKKVGQRINQVPWEIIK